MKKHLITLLLSLSFALTLAGAVACGGNNKNDSSSQGGSVSSPDESESESSTPDTTPCTVTFVNGEGYSFDANVANGGTIPGGSVLTFTVEVGAFYTGEALVYVNDVPVAPDSDGTYYVSMTEDVTVRAEGINKDVSTLSSTGLGTLESPFYVSKPIDLLYIAEQVNSGNRTYQTAAYLLINDIDCKGEELEIIGKDPDNGYYFSGSFTSNYDGETGVSYRHSISNFKINATGTNYVGLFGAVFADLSVENSANFYGITLKNFEINANMYTSDAATQTMACGGLVGYGVGANLLLCEASDGKINIAGDSTYFSFAGGLMGYQQGYYFSNYGLSAASEIAYAKADVDINVLSGLVRAAGGISGHLATDYPFGAVTSIHHSYATGDVTGAIRSGGIAGSLGQYTTVNNCYSTGLITAESNQNNSNALWQGSEYCMATAGGIVGFADNDSIVHDCYFDGEAEASAVTNDETAIAGEPSPDNKYAFASYNVGGGYKDGYISVDSKQYQVVNCPAGSEIDLADVNAFKNALSWQAYDWVFTANEYPLLNYETTSEQVSLTMTLRYVAGGGTTEIFVEKQSSVTHVFFDNTVESASYYAPMGNFFATGSLSLTYEADNGYLSYGYFFDEACTKPVPYAYMPAKNVTLYVGFADPAPIVGEFYYAADNGRLVTLDFKADGTVVYTDGSGTLTTVYSFDGENLLINSARLARYYLGKIVVDETDDSVFVDANFDLYRYYYYNFAGKLTDEGIALYDGVYFTESAPLTAGKTKPTTQPNLPMNSYTGTWLGENFTIAFNAIGANGTGTALLTYEDESTLDLLYEDAETAGYTAIYLTDDTDEKGSLFGYFYYDASKNVLRAVLSDSSSTTGFISCTLLLRDDCYGEWITESADFGNAEFIFDGMGLYGQGRVQIIKDGQSSTVNYSLTAEGTGSFNYAGKAWSFTFNADDRSISITGDPDTELERKDFFANKDFVDQSGNRYAFDGKGNLSVGGTFTVNGTTEYAYKADGTQDGQYLVYNDLGADAIGSISLTDTYVSLVIGDAESKLYIANALMGDWAISGEFALFTVGPTDLNGEISANYRGHDVTLVCLDTTLYLFAFTEDSGLPMQYYVFVIRDDTTGDNVLALSEAANLLGDYIVCSRANEMFGRWTRADGKATITFDGVSSGYQSGIAVLSKPLASDTLYYYTIKEDGILMWSQNLLQGRTKYFLIEMTDDLTNASAFVKDGKAFVRSEVDGLCLTRATDTATGETYLFDGLCIGGGNGGIWSGDVKKYEYTFITYNSDKTATLTVIDLETGKTYEATLDYRNQQNVTFTLGEEIAESKNA